MNNNSLSSFRWETAISQLGIKSFQDSSLYTYPPKRDPSLFVGPPRNKGVRADGPTALASVLAWFTENPDDTITVDDLAIKFNLSSATAYRIQRILVNSKLIFRHTRPGRKNGIQYGLLPPLVIPTKQDIRPERKK